MLHSNKPRIIFTLHRKAYIRSSKPFKDNISHVPNCSDLFANTAIPNPVIFMVGSSLPL
jgi:hypothetical protein